MARYWVGGDADTDWSNSNNWSTSSGGAGGAGVPNSTQDVYFDANGSGNCYLTENSACSGIYFTSGITYDFYDSGYQLELYGDVNAYSTTEVLQSTGTWIQKRSVNSGTMTTYPTSNNIAVYVLDSGVSISLTNYFHCNKLICNSGSTLTGGNQFMVLTYPTQSHFVWMHETFSNPTGMRWYVGSTNVSHSGVNGQIASLHHGYGGADGATMTWLGDVKIGSTGTGQYHIHASNGAITEAQARKVDMNGYNLNCGQLILGAGTASYNGYAGMIKFGTGTHNVSHMEVSYTGTNYNTYAYWDWGSGVINVIGNCDFEVSAGSHTHNGATIFKMNGAGSAFVNCSGMQLPTVEFNKTVGGVWLESNLNCDDFNYRGGSIDQNGYLIVMPQRVRPLTLGGLKTFIGKKWVN